MYGKAHLSKGHSLINVFVFHQHHLMNVFFTNSRVIVFVKERQTAPALAHLINLAKIRGIKTGYAVGSTFAKIRNPSSALLVKVIIQWGFEYRTIWSSDFKWFGVQMVGLCDMSYVLEQLFEYWTSSKQDGVYLSGIQMSFEYQTI